MTTQSSEDRRYVILHKLSELGQMNVLEIGFSASAPAIHNMAKRGLIRVRVEMTDRGRQYLDEERARRLRKKTNTDKDRRRAVGDIF